MGGATVRKPQNEWEHRDLPVYFSEVAKRPSRTPTRFIPTATGSSHSAPSSGNRRRTGIIAGAIIAGLVLVISIVLLIFCLRKQRVWRHRSAPQSSLKDLSTASTLPATIPKSEDASLAYRSPHSSDLLSVSTLSPTTTQSQNSYISPTPVHEAPSSPPRSLAIHATIHEAPSSPDSASIIHEAPSSPLSSELQRTGSIGRTPINLYFAPTQFEEREKKESTQKA